MAYIGKNPNVNSLKLNGSSTPPTPASEGMVYYDDGLGSNAEGLYVYDGTNWVVVGSGLGLINYMGTDSDAEIGIGNWVDYADAAGTEPVDGTGGAPTIALTASSSAPLRGLQSYLSTKDAVNRQGEGHSCPFTIDTHDQAQMLTISFDYDASDADYVDGDLRIFVYDITNSKLIRVNGEELKGGKGTHIAQFQTAVDSVSYRLIVHQATTNAAAVTVKLDNVQVGPRSVVKGAAMTDIVAWTPTGSWTTNTTYLGEYRRVGDHLHGKVTIEMTGAPSPAVDLTFTDAQLLNGLGLSVDQDKLPSTGDKISSIGSGSWKDNGTSRRGATGVVYDKNESKFKINGPTFTDFTPTVPITFAANDSISFEFQVPIKGWSSNAILSEDISGREIYVEAAGNNGGGLTADVTDINWTEVEDSVGAWDGTTFTVPETGIYKFSGAMATTGSTAQAVRIYVNGSQGKTAGFEGIAVGNVQINTAQKLNKGDLVTFRSNITVTLANNSQNHTLVITKLANPQTILDTALVSLRYTSDNGSSVPTSDTTHTYEDKDYDSHNAYSSGVFTAPKSAKYKIRASYTVSNGNLHAYFIRIFKNGTETTFSCAVRQATNSAPETPQVEDVLDLSKDDTVEIKVSANVAGNTMVASGTDNVLTIIELK